MNPWNDKLTLPEPPKDLARLDGEIRSAQMALKSLISVPWEDKSPSFKVGLMELLGETCQTLAELLITQYELVPGARAEFNRQVEEVIDEITAGWEQNAEEGSER